MAETVQVPVDVLLLPVPEQALLIGREVPDDVGEHLRVAGAVIPAHVVAAVTAYPGVDGRDLVADVVDHLAEQLEVPRPHLRAFLLDVGADRQEAHESVRVGPARRVAADIAALAEEAPTGIQFAHRRQNAEARPVPQVIVKVIVEPVVQGAQREGRAEGMAFLAPGIIDALVQERQQVLPCVGDR